MHWVLSAFIASFIIATSYLIRKKILQKHSIFNLMFYIYIGLIISATVCAILIKYKEGIKYFDNQTKVLALAAGAMIPFAIYSLTNSLKNVKNPAYTSIVFAVFQTIILFLLSIYILKSSYNKFTLIGTFIALVGVAIIVLNQ
jgi:drug/metabolite transporter (DMT)-like permease